jgi:hypothetical protein
MMFLASVMPAKAGIPCVSGAALQSHEIPAFAGMTGGSVGQ